MKVRLIKVSGAKQLRTNEVIGESVGLPVKGLPFVMTSESLTPGATMRLVTTTEVTELTRLSEKSFEFNTRNSIYRVEVLE